jgi:hypothetical protein
MKFVFAFLIALLVAFAAGYFQGMQEPREPTFAERVYHQIDLKKERTRK